MKNASAARPGPDKDLLARERRSERAHRRLAEHGLVNRWPAAGAEILPGAVAAPRRRSKVCGGRVAAEGGPHVSCGPVFRRRDGPGSPDGPVTRARAAIAGDLADGVLLAKVLERVAGARQAAVAAGAAREGSSARRKL